MNEGGQSSTGQLIDFVLKTHPAFGELQSRASQSSEDLFDVLYAMLENSRREHGVSNLTELTMHLHMYPDLHGEACMLQWLDQDLDFF
jgi:ribulose kinase